MQHWGTPDSVRNKFQRRFDSGSLLRDHINNVPFEPVSLPIKTPKPEELIGELARARAWAERWKKASADGKNFFIVEKLIGAKSQGSSAVPGWARLESYGQAWNFLGVTREVRIFERLVREAASNEKVSRWALAQPIKALQLAAEWQQLLAASDWLENNRGSGLYVREITAVGVDTKFIERHRATLAAIFDAPSVETKFLAHLGLSQKPVEVKMRFDARLFGFPEAITHGSFRLDELENLQVSVALKNEMHVVIVENEISFLSVPQAPARLIIWGRGFDVANPAKISWLREAHIFYWGDIDTHGFAILDRLRARLPQAESILMDRPTLLKHLDRLSVEPKPTQAMLSRLRSEEQQLYSDLLGDLYAVGTRLEQERIDWQWALAELDWNLPDSI